MPSIQQLAWRHFTKKNALSLRPDAVAFLEDRLGAVPPDDIPLLVEYIANAYATRSNISTGGMVEVDELREVLEQMFRTHQSQTETVVPKAYVKVVEDAPLLKYDPINKTYFYSVGGDMIDRYLILAEQVRRLPSSRALTAIKDALIKHADNIACFGLVGMTVDDSNGQYFLEDLEDQIPLDFTQLESNALKIYEGIFVIIYGDSRDGRLIVKKIELPSIESRDSTIKQLRFPDPLKVVAEESEHPETLKNLEKKCVGAFLVCFADVWLDRQDSLDQFDQRLSCYIREGRVPSIMILLGSFHSKPPNIYDDPRGTVAEYTLLFSELAQTLRKHDKLMNDCKFVIVPGPLDPFSAPDVMPRQPFPVDLFSAWKDIDFVLASDPCRLFWFSRELVFTRQDLFLRINRQPPVSGSAESTSHLEVAKYVTSQGFLLPFSPSVQPVRPNAYGTLSMFPLPHLLVIADASREVITEDLVEGTVFANPASFADSGSFIEYCLL